MSDINNCVECGHIVTNENRDRLYQTKNGLRCHSCSRKKHNLRDDSRLKLSVSHSGKKHSEITRKKIANKLSGENNPMHATHGRVNPMSGKTHTKESCDKIALARKTEQISGVINPMKGRKHSRHSILKMRLKAIERLNIQHGGNWAPSFNKHACIYLDEFAVKNNLTLLHAMNGGEFHIKELGYWVDGYDEKQNLVVEYYEKSHYDVNGFLLSRDILREQEIIQYLGCKFIRINAFDRFNIKVEKIN